VSRCREGPGFYTSDGSCLLSLFLLLFLFLFLFLYLFLFILFIVHVTGRVLAPSQRSVF